MIYKKRSRGSELKHAHLVLLSAWTMILMCSPGYSQNRINQDIEDQMDSVALSLQKGSIMLNNVLIEAKEDYLAQLVLAAYKNIPKNYPKKTHQLKGLYRKLSTQDNRYVHMEEGLVTIQDHGYRPNCPNPKIRMSAFRQSNEHGNVDSSVVAGMVRMREYGVKQFGRSASTLYRHYYNNYLRKYYEANRSFNYSYLLENIDNHHFQLMDIAQSEADTIYQIAIRWIPYPEKAPDFSGNSYLKINVNDMAILEFQMTVGFPDDILHQNKVVFRKQNGLYYPSKIIVTQKRFVNREYEIAEFEISTFWFDEILDHDFPKLKTKYSLDEMEIDNFRIWPYHPAQWVNSKYIKNHPLPDDVRYSLELEMVLEEQFKMLRKNDL